MITQQTTKARVQLIKAKQDTFHTVHLILTCTDDPLDTSVSRNVLVVISKEPLTRLQFFGTYLPFLNLQKTEEHEMDKSIFQDYT